MRSRALEHPLVRRFVAEELSAHVKSLLENAITEARRSSLVESRSFDFNVFAVTIDFRAATVTLEDDLDPEPSGAVVISLPDFEKAISGTRDGA